MSKNKSQKSKLPKKVLITRTILFLLIIIWAYLVFSFSNQDGPESSGLSRKVVEVFIKNENTVDLVEPYARKFAHFSEYGLGGCLFILLFSTYDWTDKKKIISSIGLGVWYASIDEIHQLIVPARSGKIADVWIDSLGFATGIVGVLIIFKIIEILQNIKEGNDESVKF